MSAHNFVRMEGRRFGNLVVKRRVARDHRRYAVWECVCDCGTTVAVCGHKLRADKRVTCAVNHGRRSPVYVGPVRASEQHPREFVSFRKMHDRCRNQEEYTSRNVTICERWSGPNAFWRFLEDMGPKPQGKYTIERLENAKGYEPDNCVWATDKQQARNRSDTVFVTYEGQKVALAALVERFGAKSYNVRYRLKAGWTLADALFIPTRPHKKKPLDTV